MKNINLNQLIITAGAFAANKTKPIENTLKKFVRTVCSFVGTLTFDKT